MKGEQYMEHKVADPGPLGLSAFALTTFCLSSANAGLWKGAGVAAALSLAFFYGGLTQLLAGMWEFVRNNTFGAYAFSTYGAFWLALYALVNWQKAFGANGSTGIFLLGFTIVTAILTIASFKTSRIVSIVFVLLTITFIALTAGNWGMVGAHSGMVKLGGWLGLATAAAAWYGAAAGVINSTYGRKVLPS
jgi:succinate-acetate transporter protein